MQDLDFSYFRYSWSTKIQILVLCYSAVLLITYNFYEIFAIHQSLSNFFVNQENITAQEFEVEFNIMICFQAFGNIIFSLLFGHLSDTLGHRAVLFILSLLVLGSQFILHLAYNQLNFLLIDLGRCMCSVSFVCILMPMSKIIRKYFEPENKFPLYNAILVSFWILGSILNSFIAPSFIKAYGIINGELITLFFAIAAALICWLLCLIDALNDKKYISQALIKVSPQEITQTHNDFSKYRSMITDHSFLFISLMIERGILTIFICVATIFFYQYWGTSCKMTFFMNEVYDSDTLGLFWLVTFVLLFPAGIGVNSLKNHKLYVLLASGTFQLIGLMFMTIFEPFYTMPLLGVSMALRSAIMSPILLERFKNDFGAAYGAVLCLSNLVIITLSFISSQILQQTGSYLHVLIILTVLQGVGLIFLLFYIRYDPHKIQMEEKTISTE